MIEKLEKCYSMTEKRILFLQVQNKEDIWGEKEKEKEKNQTTEPIKRRWSNRTAIGQKTNPNQYALVLIITKPIFIGSVINLKKNRADRIVHNPKCEDDFLG